MYKWVNPRKSPAWVASLNMYGETNYVGRFEHEVAAAVMRDVAAIQLHGEFAVLNFPMVQVALERIDKAKYRKEQG